MDLATLGALAALALVDSTSIGTLIIPLWLMLDPAARQGGRIPLYLATITLFYFLVGLALAAGARVALAGLAPLLETQPAIILQLALGVGLFILSFVIDPGGKRKQGQAPGDSPWLGRISRAVRSPRGIIGLGLLAGVLELPTMLPYLGAIALVTNAGLAWPQLVLTLVFYCLVMILPALVILGVRVVAAAWLDPRLGRLSGWFAKNAASATGWVVGILGVLLAWDALGRLDWVQTMLADFGA